MKYLNMLRICATPLLGLLLAPVTAGAENGSDAERVRDIEDPRISPCCWTQPISHFYTYIDEKTGVGYIS